MELSNTTFQYMILAIVLLVVFNIVTLVVVFATGIGKRVLQRIKQRWRYKYGKHVNVIFIRNNHVSNELFLKKEDDGSFEIEDKKYSVNPLCTFIHDGIPTQINHEGIVEPYNIFEEKDAKAMTTAEITNIIMNNEVQGLIAWIKKMFFWTLILLGIIAIIAAVAAYYGYSLHDFIIKKDLLANHITTLWQASQVAAQNSTSVVVPR